MRVSSFCPDMVGEDYVEHLIRNSLQFQAHSTCMQHILRSAALILHAHVTHLTSLYNERRGTAPQASIIVTYSSQYIDHVEPIGVSIDGSA